MNVTAQPDESATIMREGFAALTAVYYACSEAWLQSTAPNSTPTRAIAFSRLFIFLFVFMGLPPVVFVQGVAARTLRSAEPAARIDHARKTLFNRSPEHDNVESETCPGT